MNRDTRNEVVSADEHAASTNERAAPRRSERAGAAVFLPAILALILRLALLVVLGPLPADYAQPDEKEYLALAHSPSGDPDLQALLPARPPLYPLFLRWTGADARALVAQALVGAIAVWLIGWLARRGGRRAAWAAGCLLAFDPISILYTIFYTSEILFTLLLAVALALWLRSAPPLLSGFAFGLLPICRPIGLLAGPVFVPRGRRAALLFLAGWIVPFLAWGLWVRVHTGELPLARLGARNLVLYRAAPVLAEAEGIREAEAQTRLGWNTPEGPSPREAWRVLAAHPALAFRQFAASLARIGAGPGWESLQSRMVAPVQVSGVSTGPAPPDRGPRPFRLGSLAWCALGYLLALTGLLRGRRAALRLPRLRIVLLIALFVLLPAGAEGYSRFRVPVWPLIALLAGAAVARQASPSSSSSSVRVESTIRSTE